MTIKLPIKKSPIKVLSSKIEQVTDDWGLPTLQTTSAKDPLSLITLFVAPPGFGKTEFFGNIPDAIMLCCEEGHKFVKCHKIIIDCWDYRTDKERKNTWTDSDGNVHMTFLEAVEALENSDRFKYIIVDTVDSLVKMILDFHYILKKVEHAEDIGGFGKGWDIAQNTPFRRAFNRLLKTGRGVGLTTHQKTNDKQFKKGTQTKKETTLPNGVFQYLFGQLDVILHGVFGKRQRGSNQRDRLIVTEGSEEILAKNRGGFVPPEYICERGKQWQQFSNFFKIPATVEIEYRKYQRLYGKDDQD